MTPSRNIAGEVAIRRGLPPTNADSNTIDGTSIDRYAMNDPESCVLQIQCGAASGSPSSFTVDSKLEHSDTGSGGWTTVTGTSATQLTASGESRVAIDLSGCKRYVRQSVTVALTGGSSPRVPVAGALVFGGLRKLPAP